MPYDQTDTPLLYSVADAARMLGLGRSWTYELMAAGALRYVKCGRRRLVPRAALQEFADRLEAEAAAER